MGWLSKTSITAYAQRATATLPASTSKPIFAITGKVLITHLLGEVTTVIQAQANATKLTTVPNGGSAADLCATNDINADAVASYYTITGLAASAMINDTTAAGIKVANPFVLAAGTINLSCAATNTGSIKWTIGFVPLESGATIIPL